MSDDDQLSTSPELRELRDSLSGIATPQRPCLEAITARGREHRRHRVSTVARVSVVGVAAAALAIGLAGLHARGSGHSTGPTAAAGTAQTGSYTLISNTNGTVTLTVNPKELLDPAALQSDLAAHGVPAKVTAGSFCTSDPAPAGYSQVVTGPGAGTFRVGSAEPPTMTLTLDPAAIPAGTELSFGSFHVASGQQQADSALIDAGSYTCTSTAPDLDTIPPDQGGLLYGGPGAS